MNAVVNILFAQNDANFLIGWSTAKFADILYTYWLFEISKLFIHLDLAQSSRMSGAVISLFALCSLSCAVRYLYLNNIQCLQKLDTISLISTVIRSVTCTSVWSPSNWIAQESAEDVVSWPWKNTSNPSWRNSMKKLD